MNSVLHVMPRDIEALRLLFELHFATIDCMQHAIYQNRNIAQRRLSGMAKMGLLNHIGIALESRGQPTKAYFLNRAKRKELNQALGFNLSPRNLETLGKLQETDLRHQLALNSFLARLYGNTKHIGIRFRFIGEYHQQETGNRSFHAIEDEVRDPMAKGKQIRFRRDSVFCLENQRGSALFELEYDRGTEVLKSPRRRSVTLHRKVAIFLQSIQEKRFQRYSSPQFFNQPFNISRLLVVTTTNRRLENLIQALSDLDMRGIVLLTSEERIGTKDPLGEIWTVISQDKTPIRKSLISKE